MTAAGDSPTAQGASDFLAGALRLLHAHPAVHGVVVRAQEGVNSYVMVDIDIRVEMYQSWMASGQSPNGVRKQEPVTLVFFADYPLSAPIPLLREDFNCSLAHVNPGRLWSRPVPCIYEGSNSELLIQRGLGGIVDQIVVWLTNAALGTLIDPEQGWETVRRDSIDDFVVVNADAMRADQSDRGGYAAYRFDYFRCELGGKIIHYGQVGTDTVPISPKNVADYFKELRLDGDSASFAKSLALVVWSGRDHNGKPFVADQYLPETVVTLQDLQDRATLYGCSAGLADALSWLSQCLSGKTTEPLPLLVILAARRPFHLINSDSAIELNPYLLEISAPVLFPAGGATPVRPAGLRDAIAPPLLRALSGLPRALQAPALVMVGAGSLGSKIAIHGARAGLAPSHIVDRHNLSPHNSARHGLLPTSGALGPLFMGSKADALAKAVGAFGQTATSHDGNIVDILRDPEQVQQHLHKKSWAVVNSTASLTVREAFAASGNPELPRVIETTLFGQGSFGLLTVEGPKRNPDCGELITEAYDIFRKDKDARKGIFEAPEGLRRIAIGDGCGSLTMTASDARISLLAAPMADMIQGFQRDGLPQTGLIAFAKVTGQGRGLHWFDFNTPAFTRLETEDGSGWHLSISARARDKISGEVRKWRKVETGGVLVGRVSEAARTFYVADILPAPPDSRRSRSEFVLGVKGLRRTLADYVRSTNGCLYCLGTWHSHLENCGPSPLDHTTAQIIAAGRIMPSVMLIHTPAGFRAIAADTTAPFAK